jgi:hypothetical protein
MNIQSRSIFVSILYLIFLDQTDSSSEEISDDNNELLLYYESFTLIKCYFHCLNENMKEKFFIKKKKLCRP